MAGHMVIDSGANLFILNLGTVDIYEKERVESQPSNYHTELKYDRSGSEPILLVPQPSDDPNDPLVRWKTLHAAIELLSLTKGPHRIGRYGSAI